MPRTGTATYLRYIGANVRRLRLKLELTQDGLSELADIDLRFLQRIERGTVNLSVEFLVALARALGVEPSLLLRPATLLPARRGRPTTKRSTARKIR